MPGFYLRMTDGPEVHGVHVFRNSLIAEAGNVLPSGSKISVAAEVKGNKLQ